MNASGTIADRLTVTIIRSEKTKLGVRRLGGSPDHENPQSVVDCKLFRAFFQLPGCRQGMKDGPERDRTDQRKRWGITEVLLKLVNPKLSNASSEGFFIVKESKEESLTKFVEENSHGKGNALNATA